MDISIFSRKQRIVVLVFAFLVLLPFLIVCINMNMLPALTKGTSLISDQLDGESNNVQRFSAKRKVKKQAQRLPDVIIVGVKKSGTITLTKFLNYHPSIAAAGEISFFEKGYSFYIKRISLHELFLFIDEKFNKGIEFYRNKMPRARADQIVLVKARNCKL